MRKFTGKMVAALLAGTLLFSSVPTVYGAEMDEKVVTEGVETTSEVTDDVQLSEAEESLDTAEPAVQEKQNPAGSVATFEESSEEPEVTPGDDKTPGWKEVDGQKFYLDNDLKRVTGWKLLDGSWYWFDEEGIMQNGWITVNGKRYYLNSDGRMQIGWIQEGDTWYFANGSGEMQTGWLHKGGSWFWLNADGTMQKGWGVVKGFWYYFDPVNGDMVTGWMQDKDNWYYLTGSGAMQTGWLHHGSNWYYLTGSGAMARGWTSVKGTWYYLTPGNGVMKTGWQHIGNNWFYLTGSGAMHTGWMQVGSTWYYFNRSGAMLRGWNVVGSAWYYFNVNGEMQTGWNNINGFWYYLGGSNDGAMKTGWISDRGRNYYLNPDGVWKNIRIGVIGNNEAGAITTAVKFIEMGVDATVVTGSYDPSQYDGIVIPGGGDLDPSRYGQANTASSNIDNALDDRQIDAVRRCVAAGKPVFGICKGVQLMNVAFGGTLNQNIGGHMGVWHSAHVVASGWLSGVYSGSVSVLSYHHQSIRDLAPGFQVDMRAGDGTVEAISNSAKRVYGVQFHPEQMNNETGNRCIRQFVVICTN